MLSSDRGNTSFGSVEGVGGWPGCDSREVELENRYSWVFPVVLRYVASANIPDNMFVQFQLSALFLSSVVGYGTVVPYSISLKSSFYVMLFSSRNVRFKTYTIIRAHCQIANSFVSVNVSANLAPFLI
jgi:hypothetical protein